MASDSCETPGIVARLTPTFARLAKTAGQFLRQHPRWLIGLGVIALACVLLHVFNSNTREARALRRIEQLGGYAGGPTVIEGRIGRLRSVFPFNLLLSVPSKVVITGVVVEGKPATDADIAEFVAAFPKIEQIDLSSTRITDNALAEIGKLPGLFLMKARHTSVTDTGVANLASLPFLQIVELDGTQVTDAAVADLARIPRLWTLGVSGTKITDAGLAHLSGKSLHQLDVSDTQVTDAGVAAFRGANPKCSVIH